MVETRVSSACDDLNSVAQNCFTNSPICTFEGMPDDVSLETLSFEDLGDGWTRLHAQSLVDSFEGRDAWLASGMEEGVDQGYAKLDALLAGGVLS